MVLVAAVAAWLAASPSGRAGLADVAMRLGDSGLPGIAGFVVVYVGATLLMIPGTLMSLAAGFVYGPWLGLLVVSPASVLGATAAFLAGRYLVREQLQARFGPKVHAVDQAVGRRGFLVVLLLRLSPVFPFNLLNYMLGASSVNLREYVLASFLGMLPGTAMVVIAGSLVATAPGLLNAAPRSGALMAIGFFATVVVVWYSARLARRALKPYLKS